MEAQTIPYVDQHILYGCQRNDRVSQGQLYEKYFDTMSWLCARYLRDPETVTDMVHEGFLKIYQNLGKFKEKGSLEGWMKRIMINCCLDHLRKQKKRPNSISLSDAPECEVDEKVVASMQADFIMGLVQELPPILYSVFRLNVIEGYPHKEIALRLQIKESTSRAYLTEAKKQIRCKLIREVREEASTPRN